MFIDLTISLLFGAVSAAYLPVKCVFPLSDAMFIAPLNKEQFGLAYNAINDSYNDLTLKGVFPYGIDAHLEYRHKLEKTLYFKSRQATLIWIPNVIIDLFRLQTGRSRDSYAFYSALVYMLHDLEYESFASDGLITKILLQPQKLQAIDFIPMIIHLIKSLPARENDLAKALLFDGLKIAQIEHLHEMTDSELIQVPSLILHSLCEEVAAFIVNELALFSQQKMNHDSSQMFDSLVKAPYQLSVLSNCGHSIHYDQFFARLMAKGMSRDDAIIYAFLAEQNSEVTQLTQSIYMADPILNLMQPKSDDQQELLDFCLEQFCENDSPLSRMISISRMSSQESSGDVYGGESLRGSSYNSPSVQGDSDDEFEREVMSARVQRTVDDGLKYFIRNMNILMARGIVVTSSQQDDEYKKVLMDKISQSLVNQ